MHEPLDLWLIGIGTGNPEHLTLEARTALRAAAVILVPQKGPGKDDLAELRRAILASCGAAAQVVSFVMPERDPALPYAARVDRWHDEIALIWRAALAKADPRGPVALMVWGDPSLYDSTLRIAERLRPAPRLRVVPGITALQALTAAHAIPLNDINGPVMITTGRRLREEGWPVGVQTLAVMLDGACSFQTLAPDGLEIWWGGLLGLPDQLLDAGPLAEAGPRIVARRAEARARHGWMMDIYLMRARGGYGR